MCTHDVQSYTHICKKKDNLDGRRITGRTKGHTVDIYIYTHHHLPLYTGTFPFFFSKKRKHCIPGIRKRNIKKWYHGVHQKKVEINFIKAVSKQSDPLYI